MSNELLTCRRPNSQARLRFYCFPFAGAGSWPFVDACAEELPGDVRRETEFWLVDVRAREHRDGHELATTLPQLLETVSASLSASLVPPYAFFGHSMGALVSFELARRLNQTDNTAPVHLIVSGHRAPQLPHAHRPIHTLPDAELLTKLQRLDGTPPEVLDDPEAMALFMPRLRADLAVCETYRNTTSQPISGSLTALGGTDDPEVSRNELHQWRNLTHGAFSLHMFPGGHFFPHQSPFLVLRTLAQDIRTLLRRLHRHN